ncbi:MAG: hypothetical protein HYR94_24415 [Chloroflexi bacterium]|nr:hypothetical protein [Chloroflexota bacterium]
MIDDYAKTMELMRRMEAHLPISAQPTSSYIRAMRERGVKVKGSQRLQIKKLFYIGDEGGIICDVTPSADVKEVQLVSLTHLEVDPHHPLAQEIRVYQRERTRRIAQSGRSSQPSSFTIHPRQKRKR